MAQADDPGEIVRRALAYPHGAPGLSFVQLGYRSLPLEPEGGERAAARQLLEAAAAQPRRPLLAYASNASPTALARKLAPLPRVPLPVLGAELDGFDVVYSAHVSPRGSVPGTLRPSPGTTVPVALLLATEGQRRLLDATEPNYERVELRGLDLRPRPAAREAAATLGLDDAAPAAAYLSRHGPLRVGGSAVGVAEIAARGRHLPALGQREALERVRAALRPAASLERFVLDAVAAGGVGPVPGLPAVGRK